MQLSGVVGVCTDAWVSEELLVLLHAGPGAGAELQAWVPLWAQAVLEVEHRPSSDETRAGLLLLLPCACAYVSPQPPFYWPLAPGCRPVGWSWAPSMHCCWTLQARCSGARAGMDSWTMGPWRQSQSRGC